MRPHIFYLWLILCVASLEVTARPLPTTTFTNSYFSFVVPDSTLPVLLSHTLKGSFHFQSSLISATALPDGKMAAKAVLGYTRGNRPVEVYFFPGMSRKRALVIGGMHGSELSSIEVARKIIDELSAGAIPYYSVMVIPCLFPDNASAAAAQLAEIGSVKNIGRYTNAASADPNRQMPALGKAFNEDQPFDIANRLIERENQYLLKLVEKFKPERMVNIHAIRNPQKAGIFADPRTDCKGIALGYDSDLLLALTMAQYIQERGGNVSGNALDSLPTALYSTDPPIAPEGTHQKRNLRGSILHNNLGTGVSLGAWASTAVCDSMQQQKNRPAIRVITVEFPGNKRPADYIDKERKVYEKEVSLYANAICSIFLDDYYVEEQP